MPLVDVAPLYDAHGDGAVATVREIWEAATQVGFFYVCGHKVLRDLLRAVQMSAK